MINPGVRESGKDRIPKRTKERKEQPELFTGISVEYGIGKNELFLAAWLNSGDEPARLLERKPVYETESQFASRWEKFARSHRLAFADFRECALSKANGWIA